jgi:hypothetical protein
VEKAVRLHRKEEMKWFRWKLRIGSYKSETRVRLKECYKNKGINTEKHEDKTAANFDKKTKEKVSIFFCVSNGLAADATDAP